MLGVKRAPTSIEDIDSVTSTEAVQILQRRLNTRLAKRLRGNDTDANASSAASKNRTWVEVQSRGRRITADEFEALAERGREETLVVAASLLLSIPTTPDEITRIVEALQSAPQWYPGGSKEMAQSVPNWRNVESRLEDLSHFVMVSASMRATLASGPADTFVPLDDLAADLKKQGEVLQSKAHIWGDTLSSDAKRWRARGLPVDEALLAAAGAWVCGRACAVVSRTMSAMDALERVTAVQVIAKGKSKRTQESLAFAMQTMALARAAVGIVGGGVGGGLPSRELAEHGLRLASQYISVAMAEFEASTQSMSKARVMAHFEQIIKLLEVTKAVAGAWIASPLADGEQESESSLRFIRCLETFSDALVDSCLRLCEYISTPHVAQRVASPSGSHEVAMWLIFCVKYVNKIMLFGEAASAAGPSDDDKRMQRILKTLHTIETSLPH